MATTEVEDVEAWAQAEGVPSLSDPFIQKYLSGRDALVAQEKKQRSGWWFSINMSICSRHV
jgi:adenosine deaminase CECR1